MKQIVKIGLVAGIIYALTRKPETKETNETKEVIKIETPIVPVVPVTNIPVIPTANNTNVPIASTPPTGETDTPIFNEQALQPIEAPYAPKKLDLITVNSSLTKLTPVKEDDFFKGKFVNYTITPMNLSNKYASAGEKFIVLGFINTSVVVQIKSWINAHYVTSYYSIPLANIKKV